MKFSFRSIGFAVVAVLLMGCDATQDRNGDPLIGIDYTGTEVPDSAIKHKIVKKTKDILSNGHMQTTEYIYNAADRLINVKVVTNDNPTLDFKLFYDEKTKVLSRIEVEQQENGKNVKTVYDIGFNAQGKLSSAFGTAPGGIQTTMSYLYTKDTLTKIESVKKNGATELAKVEINLDHSTNTYEFNSTERGVESKKYQLLDFDVQKNPYLGVMEAFRSFLMPFNLGSTFMMLQTSKNPKEIRVTKKGESVPTIIKCTYHYNAYGYPGKVTRDDRTLTEYEY